MFCLGCLVRDCLEVFRELSSEKTGAVFISALSSVDSLLDLLDLAFAQCGDPVELGLFFCDFSAGPVGAAVVSDTPCRARSAFGFLCVEHVHVHAFQFVQCYSRSSRLCGGCCDCFFDFCGLLSLSYCFLCRCHGSVLLPLLPEPCGLSGVLPACLSVPCPCW